jgi:hypothetical protein
VTALFHVVFAKRHLEISFLRGRWAKGMSKRFLTLMILIFPLLGRPAKAQLEEPIRPVNVILDSDMVGDADDVGDHAVLWGLADCGEVNVLALITSSANDYSASTVHVLARYFGHPNVPIGAYQGNIPRDYSATASAYTKQITDEFGSAGDNRTKYPDAVTLYRQALAGAPNNSVFIIAGGYYQPLRALLQSSPDRFSALDGTKLVAQKVRRLIAAAGVFPDSGQQPEHNLAMDPDGASFVFANWPTDIVSFGYEAGWDVVTGPGVTADPAKNPVKRAYDLYCQNGRYCAATTPAWTQIAILYAVRGGVGTTFSVGGSNGSTVVWNSKQTTPGRNMWTNNPDRHHSYLEKAVPASTLAGTLNQLLQHNASACR